MFQGAMVAVVTPFKDGQLDENGLRQLIEFQIANGTAGSFRVAQPANPRPLP